MQAKILVVDDEPDVVELLSYDLKAHGYGVLTAQDGPQGIELARRMHPDLVLLDVMMEGMNGFSVCDILRRDPDTTNIPVIMVTALGTALGRANGIGAGARDYITKPFNKQDLLQRIDAAITASRASESVRPGKSHSGKM